MKPCLCLNRAVINNHFSYQNFIKKNYKYVYALEIVSPVEITQQVSKLKHCLFNLAKKCKFKAQLDLIRCPLFHYFPTSSLVKIMKLFVKTQGIYTLFATNSPKMIKIFIKWIKMLKYLKVLECLYQDSLNSTYRAASRILSNLNQKFCAKLKQTHLEKLRIAVPSFIMKYLQPLVAFQNYPSTLKSFSLISQDLFLPAVSVEEHLKGATLSHMNNLERLELAIPCHPSVTKALIASIPEPVSLIHFGLRAYNYKPIEHMTLLFLEKAQKAFGRLESLTLTQESWPQTFEYLEFLYDSPLKCLDMAVPIIQEDHMITLGYFIGNLRKLETLRLLVKGKVEDNISECFISFCHQLSLLTELQRLELTVSPKTNEIQMEGIVEAFSECIAKLPNLIELGFMHTRADFEGGLPNLVTVLKDKSSLLKKLSININSKPIKKEKVIPLLKVIQKLQGLETLILEGFGLCDNEIIEKLGKVLVNCKSLKDIRILQTPIFGNKKILWEMITSILDKENLEVFCLSHKARFQLVGRKEFERIDLLEVYKRNPRIKSIYIPQNLCLKNENMWNLW